MYRTNLMSAQNFRTTMRFRLYGIVTHANRLLSLPRREPNVARGGVLGLTPPPPNYLHLLFGHIKLAVLQVWGYGGGRCPHTYFPVWTPSSHGSGQRRVDGHPPPSLQRPSKGSLSLAIVYTISYNLSLRPEFSICSPLPPVLRSGPPSAPFFVYAFSTELMDKTNSSRKGID